MNVGRTTARVSTRTMAVDGAEGAETLGEMMDDDSILSGGTTALVGEDHLDQEEVEADVAGLSGEKNIGF